MYAMTATHFRYIVILSILFALLAVGVDPLFMPTLPVGHSELLKFVPPSFFAISGIANLVLGLSVGIGLCLFRGWSRPWSLVSLGVGAVNYLMCSYFAISGVATALGFIANSLGGGAIAIAYFSPLAQRFESNMKVKPQE